MFSKVLNKTTDILHTRVLENKLLRALVLVGISVTMFGTSYAYWSSQVEINGNVVQDVVTTAELTLDFNNTAQISLDEATPSKEVSKTFTVTNDGDFLMSYNIEWESFSSTFEDLTDLVYDLEGNTRYFIIGKCLIVEIILI